jgi:aldehyde:ferredoxin oxidoreductase
MLGSCCLINDLKAICKANDICNRYGIDTISAGAMIGFSMECYEKGLLTKEDTGGLKLKWGKGDIMIELVRQIGEKRGKLGELFAQGIIKASQVIGHGAEDIALHVKGLDIPAHDPRAFFSNAINYATGTRGACHMRGTPQAAAEGLLLPEVGITQVPDRFTMEEKAYITAKFQDLCTLYNSLTCCNFMMFGNMTITDITNGLNAITGWDFDTGELMKTAERIFTLQRVFNVICGVSRKDDKLPNRMFQPAKTGGRANKIPVPFDSTLEEYYKLRGWDIDGRPSLKKLLELGLNNK